VEGILSIFLYVAAGYLIFELTDHVNQNKGSG
jgi:hypothetical protein